MPLTIAVIKKENNTRTVEVLARNTCVFHHLHGYFTQAVTLFSNIHIYGHHLPYARIIHHKQERFFFKSRPTNAPAGIAIQILQMISISYSSS